MRLIDKLMLLLGYVPVTSHISLEKHAAETARLGHIERELRCSKRDLEYQLSMRNMLEKEVGFLRELELRRVNQSTDTCKAIARLEAVCDRLDNIVAATQAVLPVCDPVVAQF